MSICMYARVKKEAINDESLKKYLEEFFMPIGNIIIQKDENCVTYDKIYENDNVVVSFIRKKTPPYNIYDSCLCNSEFEYTQLIIFDINKEYAHINTYNKIIDFCSFLNKKCKTDILITSDVYEEICLIGNKDTLWSNNLFCRKE